MDRTTDELQELAEDAVIKLHNAIVREAGPGERSEHALQSLDAIRGVREAS